MPQPLKEREMDLPKDLKTLLPSLDEYRANIREIARIGKSLNTRVIFLTQPMLFDDTEYWREILGEFYWIKKTTYTMSAATYWRLLDIYNEELIKTCKIMNVECFDLASSILHSDLYFYDPVHFTEKGAELTAKRVAEYLKK